jgi:hypothetical protein
VLASRDRATRAQLVVPLASIEYIFFSSLYLFFFGLDDMDMHPAPVVVTRSSGLGCLGSWLLLLARHCHPVAAAAAEVLLAWLPYQCVYICS